MRTVLLAGSSHPALAREISNELQQPLGHCDIERFPDDEFDIQLHERVRGAEVFIVQSLHAPVGDHVLELALMSDACHRAGAASVTAVIPYLGYARHDRRVSGREPLGARVVAELIAASRVDRVVCLDLHSRAVEGCFPQPVEHADAVPSLIAHLKSQIAVPTVVVSPDLGAVKRAEIFARALGLSVVVVHKQRLSGAEVKAQGVVGEVAGRHVLVVDDLISTGGTLVAAIETVLDHGALAPVTVVASHGLFVGPALVRLAKLPLARVVITDSVPFRVKASFPLEIVRSAPALAEVISRLVLSSSQA